MNIKIQPYTCVTQSPLLTPNNRSSDKCLKVSSKRKLIISPSKDLIVFFGNSTFGKFNSVKMGQNQKANTKLTLSRKKPNEQKNAQQKKPALQSAKVRRVTFVSKSVESLHKSKTENEEHEERFLKLKKQVDLIRRKYSYNKISQKSFLQRVQSSEKLGLSTQNSSNNSIRSMNNQKEKNSFSIPKNERYLGKRILTKNVFAEQHSSKLRLSQTKLTKTLKMNTQQSQEMRRKKSSEFSDLNTSENFSSQMTEMDPKMTFQFTFGSMALMDFQNKGNFQSKSNKLKV